MRSTFEQEAKEHRANGNEHSKNGRENDWPDPGPVKTNLLPVQKLPFEILPEALRPWIKDSAHRMQSSPDFITMTVLTFTSSLIGTRCGIRPKKLDDWLVIPNLWGGMLGAPSTLKTPSMNEGLKPSARLEIEAKEKSAEEDNLYEVDLVEFQVQKESLKAQMKKANSGKGGKSIEDIKDELLQLKEPEKPTVTRYKTNDATIEKLSELCNENPAGLIVVADELVRLLSSWDKTGRESDRAFFLEAWNGDSSFTTDRIGRGTIFTEHLCLSVFGGIQPSKLIAYLRQSMSGFENDGLLQRFQLLVYPDEIKNWELVDKVPDRKARDRAYDVIKRLARMDFKEHGANQEEADKFPYFHFSEEGQSLFNEWLTELEIEKLRANDHPVLLEHFGKFRSLMPSLSLIFHLIDIADSESNGPVSLSATKKAAAFCEYLESHARRIYGLVGDLDQQSASALAEKIKSEKLTDGFTVRDVYRQNWHLLNTKELAQLACSELVEAGWLQKYLTPPAFGQREKVEYKINPKIQTGKA
jgi:hypothetical protein